MAEWHHIGTLEACVYEIELETGPASMVLLQDAKQAAAAERARIRRELLERLDAVPLQARFRAALDHACPEEG